MKKLFSLTVIAMLAMALTGCPSEPQEPIEEVKNTILTIYNDTDFNLLSVDYASVDFGNINRNGDAVREIEPGMRYINFSIQTDHGLIQFRTAERLNCEEGKRNDFHFLNTTVITTLITGTSHALRDYINTINSSPANSRIEVHHNNYPLNSGDTINLGDIPGGDNRIITLKIFNNGEHDLRITGTQPQISGTNASAATVQGNYSSQRLVYEGSLEISIKFDAMVNGNNAFTITILNNDQENGTFIIYVTARVLNTWEKLYGIANQRSGIFRMTDNGQGGIYAGGYRSHSIGAIFNFNHYGSLLNTFTFSANPNPPNGTLGPVGIGSAYNRFYSVFESATEGDYVITTANSPSVNPVTTVTAKEINGAKSYFYPAGILQNGNGYIVAGNVDYRSGTSVNSVWRWGVFIDTHNSNGAYIGGRFASLISPPSGIVEESFDVWGLAWLTNGDVLLYGDAETTTGRIVAFASAVNISNANPNSWAVRWTQTYPLGTRNTYFDSHFIDNSSPPNIILVGDSDGDGFITKFPLNVTTAAAARPVGWPKTISANQGVINGGLAVKDNSGYLFVGGAEGPNGGTDVWVVKTDINADTKIWERYFGGAGDDYADAVLEASDGFIVAGSTNSTIVAGQTKQGTEDIYIIKMNFDGSMD